MKHDSEAQEEVKKYQNGVSFCAYQIKGMFCMIMVNMQRCSFMRAYDKTIISYDHMILQLTRILYRL